MEDNQSSVSFNPFISITQNWPVTSPRTES